MNNSLLVYFSFTQFHSKLVPTREHEQDDDKENEHTGDYLQATDWLQISNNIRSRRFVSSIGSDYLTTVLAGQPSPSPTQSVACHRAASINSIIIVWGYYRLLQTTLTTTSVHCSISLVNLQLLWLYIQRASLLFLSSDCRPERPEEDQLRLTPTATGRLQHSHQCHIKWNCICKVLLLLSSRWYISSLPLPGDSRPREGRGILNLIGCYQNTPIRVSF